MLWRGTSELMSYGDSTVFHGLDVRTDDGHHTEHSALTSPIFPISLRFIFQVRANLLQHRQQRTAFLFT